jgi:hypothetical protein
MHSVSGFFPRNSRKEVLTLPLTSNREALRPQMSICAEKSLPISSQMIWGRNEQKIVITGMKFHFVSLHLVARVGDCVCNYGATRRGYRCRGPCAWLKVVFDIMI